LSCTLAKGDFIDRKLTVYTDGAARGNPGPSASGFMAYEGKELLHKHSEYNGKATNNFAEYTAVLLAMKWCSNINNAKELSIDLYSDNELVVRQLNQEYKVKSKDLMPLNAQISKLISNFKIVILKNVPRENIYISAVDRSLNELLDTMEKGAKTEKI
jgi:ribonuclease HI